MIRLAGWLKHCNHSLSPLSLIYLQQLPQHQQTPERPTYLKDILNAASLMAQTNVRNHINTNYFSRTLSWIRLQLRQQEFFANMEYKFVRSWAEFVCRAAADNITSIWDLLPRYPSWFNHPHTSGNFLSTWW
ncbi:TPA: hypothetical protein ACH3X3_000759 [Trebouxia sp. C0006]